MEYEEKIFYIKAFRNIDNLHITVYNNIAGRNTLYTRVTELTFKRHVMSSAARTPSGVFFIVLGVTMNIYIYSDESGVFDQTHNSFFVFGGLIFLSKQSRDEWSRRYIHAEKNCTNK